MISLLLLGALLAPPHEGNHVQLQRLNAQLAQRPEDPALLLQRAACLRLHAEPAAARADLRKLRSLAPDFVGLALEESRLAAAEEHWQAALLAVDHHLRQCPDDAGGWEWKARILHRLARFESSTAAWQWAESLQTHPQPELYHRWAGALLAGKKPDAEAALRVCERGLQRLGACISLELLAVDQLSALGRVDQALTRLQRLAAGAHRQESWWIRQGDVLWDHQRKGEAQNCYRHALDAIAALRPRTRTTSAVRDMQAHAQARLGE